MSFNTALSGLRAADQDLSVTGNNIANASTIGFKKSRTEFGDVYANSLIGGGGNQAGNGVLVTNVAQQFDQGNISFTDNALDLAINGGGFFVLNNGGAETFSRAGYFGLDNGGFLTTNNNARLQGYLADEDGNIETGNIGDLRINTQSLEPELTQQVDINFNLDSSADVPVVTTFDANDPDSFNTSSSLTIYDSQGNSHVLTQYFTKTATPNVWEMYIQVDGDFVGTPSDGAVGDPAVVSAYEITYNSDGTFNSLDLIPYNAAGIRQPTVGATNIQIDNWEPRDSTGAFNGAVTNTGLGINDPATSSSFRIDVNSSTQFSGEFVTTAVSQDGFGQGRLASVEVDETGVIFARYTNGEALTLGQVILATFENVQGLTPLGDSSWAESFESGAAIRNTPLSGSLGGIQAGALEESNVDLSEELVRLIIAQRNYQANAKTIETADTVTQAVLNIR